MAKLKFRTVILSDIHLGSGGCQIDAVNDFIRHIRCEKLILNGDIIDTWALKRNGVWTKQHSRFVRQVLKKIEKDNTRVIYLRGNHDDVLDRFLPMSFAGIHIVRQHVHRTSKGDYLVLHGDVFDAITTHMTWLAKLGDIGYTLLLEVNKWYNKWRTWRGKEYYSLSAEIKARVKGAVSFISSFEDALVNIAKDKGYYGVICGHIHTPANKMLGEVHYLNSGDWVESLTALVEFPDGRIEVLNYVDFKQMLEVKRQERKARKLARIVSLPERQIEEAGESQPLRPEATSAAPIPEAMYHS
jgi:UDP-2,3-diacylglucosamine pyrophosphatase LpxH